MGTNSKQIQAIVVILQVLITLVLVSLTYSYVYSTKEMAEVMNKEYEHNNRPFVFVKDVILNSEENFIEIYLENMGKLPAKINVANITIGSGSFEKVFPKGTYSDYSFIYPNEKISVSIPIKDEFISKIAIKKGFSGDIRIKYWKINDGKKKNTYIYDVGFKKQIEYKNSTLYNKFFIKKNVEAS